MSVVNGTGTPLLVGVDGRRDRYKRLDVGERAYLTSLVTGANATPGPDSRITVEAVDEQRALRFCRVYTGTMLRETDFTVELVLDQFACGQPSTARPMVGTAGLPLVDGAADSGIEARFKGDPSDFTVSAADVGQGWVLEEEWRAAADAETTGSLYRRFRDGSGRPVLTVSTVFRTRAYALAAWGGVPGGSFNVCEASLRNRFDDGETAGACLVQNGLFQMVGGSPEHIEAALALAGERIQDRLLG